MCLGPKWASSYYLFFLSGTSTPANVYRNGTLTTAFPSGNRVNADAYGRFAAIYLDPSIIYRVQFFNSTGVQQWQVDPYTSQLSTVGTSSLSAFGFQIAPTGEFTLDAPNTGGSGVTLTVNAGVLGTAALRVTGTLAGNSAIIVTNSATTGAQTATFAATNKPGPNITNTLLATVAPTGAAYVGGTLTANYPGATTSSAVIVLSTGQIISGATFTAGSATFTTPSTSITGTPTTTLLVTGPQASSPAGWLPITCDGVQYYTPIWHDNNFTPYAANPTANGEVINATAVTFGGNGLTAATGGTATPSNWFSPVAPGIGAGYYINITKTGGLSGVMFNEAQGVWTNITSGGLAINMNSGSTVSGTYQLSTSVSGSPIVAQGTITLSGGNGVQSPTYNGATPLNLAGNGTATFNGSGTSNWYAPTTANVGSGFYILINQTGGTAGTSFTAATGTPANITSGGLTIGVTGGTGTTYATGTYVISSDSAGTVQLGSGSITLNGSNVQSSNWSGTTPLFLAGNGTATLNGTSTSAWYSPTTSNVGSGYWINITRTGGTTGVNFSAAQGSWTNITNSGLTIDMSGYSGLVGSASVNGTYQISSSASGTPVLGSGTISLSISGLTVTHSYTSGTAATETVPTGATKLEIIADGGGGSGGNSFGVTGGGGGGSGEAHSTNITVSGGQTLTYTVGVGGAATVGTNNGNAGTASTVTGNGGLAGVSLTANGGGPGTTGGVGGSGGTASGGNSANLTGSSGGVPTGGAAASGASGGSPPGTPGGGSNGFNRTNSLAGGAGQIVFKYS